MASGLRCVQRTMQDTGQDRTGQVRMWAKRACHVAGDRILQDSPLPTKQVRTSEAQRKQARTAGRRRANRSGL